VKRLTALVLASASLLMVPAAANAGVLVQSATSCDTESLSRPFLPWLDVLRYTLVPGGAFEPGSPAWKRTGDAAVVAGNESFRVHGSSDAWSLRLGAGSSAQSPAMCVGIDHPTLRLFARRTGGSLLSTLRVDALVEDNLGLISSLPVGVVAAGGQWSPSLPQVVLASLLPLLPGGNTPVVFRLTPQGAGTWDVDDVYVDPWSSR
jgi:hypothetical protein